MYANVNGVYIQTFTRWATLVCTAELYGRGEWFVFVLMPHIRASTSATTRKQWNYSLQSQPTIVRIDRLYRQLICWHFFMVPILWTNEFDGQYRITNYGVWNDVISPNTEPEPKSFHCYCTLWFWLNYKLWTLQLYIKSDDGYASFVQSIEDFSSKSLWRRRLGGWVRVVNDSLHLLVCVPLPPQCEETYHLYTKINFVIHLSSNI